MMNRQDQHRLLLAAIVHCVLADHGLANRGCSPEAARRSRRTRFRHSWDPEQVKAMKEITQKWQGLRRWLEIRDAFRRVQAARLEEAGLAPRRRPFERIRPN